MNGFLSFALMLYISSLFPCIGLGFIPASVARTKGYRYFGLWWLFGWLAFIVAMITVLCLKDKGKNRIRCKACGHIMNGLSNYCENCGNGMPKFQKCPSCGARLDEHQKYCLSCGQKVITPGRGKEDSL